MEKKILDEDLVLCAQGEILQDLAQNSYWVSGLSIECVVVVQSLSHVWLFATPWTTAARLFCPPLSPRVCSNLYPLSQWCYLTISSSATTFFFCFQSFPASGSFPMSRLFDSGDQSIGTSASTSILPNEYSGLIYFRIDWYDLLTVQGTSQESSSTPKFESINSLALDSLYCLTLSSVHDYWKNFSFDYIDLCWQSKVSAF